MRNEIYAKLHIPDEERYMSITAEEGEELFNLLRKNESQRTMEVGLAYGASTAYIMSATNGVHVAIDPYQESFQNLGLRNIESLGLLKKLDFRPEPSLVALPQLAKEGRRFDFVFIDGEHKFDDAFTEWVISDSMLEPRGLVVFHDTYLPSIQHVASFIRTNRSDYEEVIIEKSFFFAFRKSGMDKRKWDHFGEFCIKNS
jgi:predicted O-methyltransferase YrrM